MTDISIIIPAFNCSDTIGRAVISSLTQSIPLSIEVIVIDDGSDENTKQSIAGLPNDDRLKILRLNKNIGPAGARNIGIEFASGRYIALLDADDVMHPQRLYRQHKQLIAGNSNLAAVLSWTLDVDSSGKPIRLNRFSIPMDNSKFVEFIFLGTITAVTPTIFLRKDVISNVGNFDYRLQNREDSDFLLRILTRYSISCVSAPLVRRRVHNNSMSNSVTEEIFIESRRLFFEKATSLYPFLNRLSSTYWAKSYCILARKIENKDIHRARYYYLRSIGKRLNLKAIVLLLASFRKSLWFK